MFISLKAKEIIMDYLNTGDWISSGRQYDAYEIKTKYGISESAAKRVEEVLQMMARLDLGLDDELEKILRELGYTDVRIKRAVTRLHHAGFHTREDFERLLIEGEPLRDHDGNYYMRDKDGFIVRANPEWFNAGDFETILNRVCAMDE